MAWIIQVGIPWALKRGGGRSSRSEERQQREAKGEAQTWVLTWFAIASFGEGRREPRAKERWQPLPTTSEETRARYSCQELDSTVTRTWKGFFPEASSKRCGPANTPTSAWWDTCWTHGLPKPWGINLCCFTPWRLCNSLQQQEKMNTGSRQRKCY